MSKKKISIIINTSWNIYNFRKGLVNAFLAEGWEVHAIAPEDEYSKRLTNMGCIFHPIQVDNKGSNPIKDLQTTLSFRKILKEIKPDISLHYTVKPNIYATLAARTLGIPVISNISGLGTIFIRQNFISKIGITLYKLALKHPKVVFFQNPDDKTLFLKKKIIKETQAKLLAGSGIDTNYFTPFYKENNHLSFLMVARLIYDKGILEYYASAKKIKKESPNVTFNICGFIEPESQLGVDKKTVEKWQKEGVINYLGTTDDIKSIINQHQIIVLPSYREGTPKTLLEAAATAKPIITTDVPGCREVVKDGINGYLCEAKSIDDLAEKIKKMIKTSPESRQKMGEKGRELVLNKFDQRFVIETYITEIEKI